MGSAKGGGEATPGPSLSQGTCAVIVSQGLNCSLFLMSRDCVLVEIIFILLRDGVVSQISRVFLPRIY